MPRIDSFLRLVVDQKASDLHLPAGSPPIIRHNGDLIPLPFRVLTSLETQRLVCRIALDIVHDGQQVDHQGGNGVPSLLVHVALDSLAVVFQFRLGTQQLILQVRQIILQGINRIRRRFIIFRSMLAVCAFS